MVGIKIRVIYFLSRARLRMEQEFCANPSKVIFQIPFSIIYRSQGADSEKGGNERALRNPVKTDLFICFPRRFFDDTNPSNPLVPIQCYLHATESLFHSLRNLVSRGKRDVRKNEIQRGVRIHRCEREFKILQIFYWHIPLGFISIFSLCFSCLWIFRISYCVWSLS